MNLHLEKARKLIDALEARLQATSSHTSNARDILHRWLQTGEGQMRKKSASALKQVRRRADGFTKALTKVEENLSRSLGKLAEKMEKPAKKKPKTNVVTAAPRPATAAPVVLASSTQGNGFLYGFSLLIAGILALYAGLNSSYAGQQKKAGRQGEFSLLGDIKDGRPPLKTADEENAVPE